MIPTVDYIGGCRKKIERADEHAETLRERLWTYGHPSESPMPVYIDYQHDRESREITPIARDVAPPPLQEWGVIVGDLVHNLRSALDQLVWGLSVKHSKTPPPDPIPRGDPWRKVGFPVHVDPLPRNSQGREIPWTRKPPDALRFVRPGLLADFQRLQPFATGQQYSPFHPLALLNELWNTDKHHTIALLGLLTTLRGVLPNVPPHLQLGPPFRKEDYEVVGEIVGELKDDAPLGRIRYTGTEWINNPAVPMKLDLTIQIGLDQRPSGQTAKDKLRLGENLDLTREFVAEIIEYFAPELPWPPP